MSGDQQLAFDWIADEVRLGGVNTAVMPFKLAKFRSLRNSLVGTGLVVRTADGRYIPAMLLAAE